MFLSHVKSDFLMTAHEQKILRYLLFTVNFERLRFAPLL